MAPSSNGNGDGGENLPALQEQQFVLLGFIQVVEFAANPAAVMPFGTTTLSWQVTLPTTLHVPVTLIVAGKRGAPSATAGSTTATLTDTATFSLTAATEIVSRVIKTLTVPVDQSDCKIFPTVRATVVTQQIADALNARFSGGSRFTLRSGGTQVLPVLGGVNITIPLHLNIPHWFDADMDITILLRIWMKTVGTVTVDPLSTEVHVDWTWFQDLAGCTSFGEKLSQALMSDIVANELAPAIAQRINDQVQSFAVGQQNADPLHRTFVLTSFAFGPDGFGFTVCPHNRLNTGPIGPAT